MNRYQLYLKIEDVWRFNCDIEAEDHSAALRKAIGCLRPEHYALPLRLEQVEKASDAREPKKGAQSA